MTSKTILLLPLFTIMIGTSASAQCSFNPTVTPSNLILCPGSQDTLWTQTYDSYQWYKDNVQISGATNQYYVVDYSSDAASNFSVAATVSLCTELSPPVLVDGWAFLFPVVQHEGDQGWFDGQYLHLCTGDTMILILLQPYDTLIQWFDGFTPIPGATDDTLFVTADGDYTVQGAPFICPNYIQQLGVTISAVFHQPVTPSITQVNDTLFTSPANASFYQWYLNSMLIPGANNYWFLPTGGGSYTVEIVDSNQCTSISSPYIILSITDIEIFQHIKLFPNPVADKFVITNHSKINFNYQVFDILGQWVMQIRSGNFADEIEVDVSNLQPGVYFIKISSERMEKSIKLVKI